MSLRQLPPSVLVQELPKQGSAVAKVLPQSLRLEPPWVYSGHSETPRPLVGSVFSWSHSHPPTYPFSFLPPHICPCGITHHLLSLLVQTHLPSSAHPRPLLEAFSRYPFLPWSLYPLYPFTPTSGVGTDVTVTKTGTARVLWIRSQDPSAVQPLCSVALDKSVPLSG